MKKVLILSQNCIAETFLKKIVDLKDTSKQYILISLDTPEYKHNFLHIQLDPTNAARLEKYLDENVEIVYILLKDEEDIRLSYNAVRSALKRVNIVITSSDDIYSNDMYVNLVKPKQMLANHLIDLLPNMPMIARYIGFGQGEIMQVKVPNGSIYANKHISAIAQEFYKVALIYRNQKVILPKPETQILANDELLLVGDANILNLVFSRIKGQVGQFPSPYGETICTIIDMKNDKNITNIINTSILLHTKSNSSKLIFYVLNPTINSDWHKLKTLNNSSINVKFEYDVSCAKSVVRDFCNKDSGLFIVSKYTFFKNKKELYDSSMPILKVGSGDFSELNSIVCIGTSSLRVENLTSTILDFGVLLNIRAKLLYFDMNNEISEDLQEHVSIQSQFFGKKLELIDCKSINPLFEIKNDKKILHCLGFEQSILKTNTFKYMSNDFNKMYNFTGDNFQLFIPIE